MVQDEHGLESCCICPVCFTKCSLCINDKNLPLSKGELEKLIKKRESMEMDSPDMYDD